MSIRGNAHSGKCPFGELSFGELSVGEISVQGIVRSRNCPLGNCRSGNCLLVKCLRGIVHLGKVRRGTVRIPYRFQNIDLRYFQQRDLVESLINTFYLVSPTCQILPLEQLHRAFPCNLRNGMSGYFPKVFLVSLSKIIKVVCVQVN